MAATLGTLKPLLQVTRLACAEALTPLVRECYSALNGSTSELKADKSFFSIADGLVQALLSDYLFKDHVQIVGEESVQVNVTAPPYTVGNLTVPSHLVSVVDEARDRIDALSASVASMALKDLGLTVFIDPIDGTREFCTGLGEQCTICIGFAQAGEAVGGVVMRPLTTPVTWAAGCKRESYAEGELSKAATPTEGLLTSNGSISPWISALIEELNIPRVRSGGVGNKVLMLLEGKGSCYIQDRGVSRWDTCAAQAIVEAYSGVLLQLHPFVESKAADTYQYRLGPSNTNFVPGLAEISPYNAASAEQGNAMKGQKPTDVSFFAPYSNLNGLLALREWNEGVANKYHDAAVRACAKASPAYN